MTLPDNRLRLPSTPIDFDTEVGITGQDHDNWPAPGEQARYDWMRLWLVALLANQSSFDEPTQYRDGSLWFDLNTNQLKVRVPSDGGSSSEWMDLSDVISVGGQSLTDYVSTVQGYIAGLAPEMTWSGHSTNSGVTVITVPAAIASLVDVNNTCPTVYVNGLLMDPRTTPWYTGPSVRLVGWSLTAGDTFTVIVRNISGSRFHIPEVAV